MTTHYPSGVAYVIARAKLENPRVSIGVHNTVTFDATIGTRRADNGSRLIKCSLTYTVPDAADIHAGTYDVDAKVGDMFSRNCPHLHFCRSSRFNHTSTSKAPFMLTQTLLSWVKF
jgi:hypothetical protein